MAKKDIVYCPYGRYNQIKQYDIDKNLKEFEIGYVYNLLIKSAEIITKYR